MTYIKAGSIDSGVNLAFHPKWTTSALTYQFYTALTSFYNSLAVPFEDRVTGLKPLYSSVFDSGGLNSVEQAAIVRAFALYSSIAPLTFTTAGTGVNADIGIGGLLPSYLPRGVGAWASPGHQPAGGTDTGDIWLPHTGGRINPTGSYSTDYGYHAIAHEIGHVLGLKHTFEGPDSTHPALTGQEDTNSFSIMAKDFAVNESRYASDLQLYDIASIQWLYGANKNYRIGGDTYAWFDFVEESAGGVVNRYVSIWDGDGEDRISAAADPAFPNLAAAAFIDLRPGHFSSLGSGTLVSVVDHELRSTGVQNVSIAFGTVIENATGTGHNDAIIGNVYANKIDGGAGDDMLFGSGSAVREIMGREAELGIGALPVLDDDDGDYRSIGIGTFVSSTAPMETTVTDEIYGGAGGDLIVSGDGPSKLYGDGENDILVGGGGDDQLFGGAGDDQIWGDDGTDTADYHDSTSPITVNYDGTGTLPAITVKDGLGGTDTLHSIEKIIGTIGRDLVVIKGQILADTKLEIDAHGGQGASPKDTINMKAAQGVDAVINIDGTGQIYNIGHKDVADPKITLSNFHTAIIGSDYDDNISDLSSGTKTIDAGEGNNEITVGGSGALVMGRSGNDTIHGSDGGDTLIGGGGYDVIEGGGGNDWIDAGISIGATLTGGAGDDVLVVENGANVLINFTTGSGHDSVIVSGPPPSDGPGQAMTIDFGALSASDCTLIWNYHATELLMAPIGHPIDIMGIYAVEGPAAVRINATGETIFLGNLQGAVPGYPSDYPALTGTPIIFENQVSHGLNLQFANGGAADGGNILSSDVAIDRSDPTQYNIAPGEIATEQAADTGNTGGTSGDDTLSGGNAGGSIAAGGGNDTIYSAHGNYAIDGGAGFDTYTVLGNWSDYTFSLDGGTLVMTNKTGFEGVARLTNVEMISVDAEVGSISVADIIAMMGTANDDIITGTAWDDTLHGAAGNDMIDGGAGDDVVYGDAGDDNLTGGGGLDVLVGGTGNDTYRVTDSDTLIVEAVGEGVDLIKSTVDYVLAAGVEIETIRLAEGSAGTSLTGNAFSSKLIGNANDNVLDGGGGGDALRGGLGNDTYIVRDASDRIVEASGEGNDIVQAAVSYTLTTDAFVETLRTIDASATTAINLTGNDHTLVIQGNAGANVLTGGAGNETISGFGGNDTLFGGGGNDVFAFASGTGQDSVGDFVSGSDKLDLSAFFSSFAQVQAATHDVGGNAVIDLGGGNNVTLSGFLTAQLQSGDVILSGGAAMPADGGAHTMIVSRELIDLHDVVAHQPSIADLWFMAPTTFPMM